MLKDYKGAAQLQQGKQIENSSSATTLAAAMLAVSIPLCAKVFITHTNIVGGAAQLSIIALKHSVKAIWYAETVLLHCFLF